jgi:membrane protein DedA with SNARE-associated domain
LFTGIGYLCADQWQAIANTTSDLSGSLAALVLVLLASYALRRAIARTRHTLTYHLPHR